MTWCGAVLLAWALALVAAAPAESAPTASRAIPDRPLGTRGGITPISAINANDASGFSNLEFVEVTIEGIVESESGRFDPFDRATPSGWFYVSDGTGTLAIAQPGAIVATPSPGELVQVRSVVLTQGLAPLRGTRTLDFEVFGIGEVTVVGSGTVGTPFSISAAQLQSAGSTFEGRRVRLDGLTIVDAGEWPAQGSSGFVRATDGVTTIRFFIDDDSNLDGATPPSASFALLGFVAQDAPNFSSEGEHFVYPASLADVVTGDGSGLLAVVPSSVLQGQVDVALAFTLTGQEATLETLEIDIPVTWPWDVPGDLALSGPGFSGATASFTVIGGITTVRVTGAAVTATDTGTVVIGSLRAPDVPGDYELPARSATVGGTPAPLTASPVVRVFTDADAGDVVVNEVYPNTSSSAAGREEAEFIELRNRTAAALDVSGWQLADIGRSTPCGVDVRWQFPAGTSIPAGGFLVVCRTAIDPQGPGPEDDRGFLVEFPEFTSTGAALFELFDASSEEARTDDPATPNLTLLTPSSLDDQIALLGGFVTNVGQCESPSVPGRFLPFQELVLLFDLQGEPIDALEYREPGPCAVDICGTGFTGPNDAYAFGPPKPRHTLGRNAASDDTNASFVDVFPSSQPTPGIANVPGDTVPPALDPPPFARSTTLIEVSFDETVDESTAADPSRYRIAVPSSGDTLAVLQVLPDPERATRHFILVTESMPAGETVTLLVNDVRDPVIGGAGGNALFGAAQVTVPAQAQSICTVQEFNESGFSPSVGDTVSIAGVVTIGDIDPVALGEPPPTDRMSIWVQEPGGCGVNVFAFFPDAAAEYETQFPDVREFGIEVGDFVAVRGRVVEFVSSTSGAGAVTEIEAIAEDTSFYRFLLRGLGGIEPRVVTTHEANDETLEGSLVQTEGTVIAADERALFIDDGTGSIQVFSNFSASIDLTLFTIGDRLQVTGVITQFDSTEPFFSGYELVPVSQESIVKLGGGFSTGGPTVEVDRRVLVPDLGETIRIVTNTPERSDAIIEIYDAIGEKVTTLYDGVGLGEVVYNWDGTGDRGDRVDPGVYICHIRAVALDGGSVETASAPIVVGMRLDGSGAAR